MEKLRSAERRRIQMRRDTNSCDVLRRAEVSTEDMR